MKKLENLGRILSQNEQEKITGGAGSCLTKGSFCTWQPYSCCTGTTCKTIFVSGGISYAWCN